MGDTNGKNQDIAIIRKHSNTSTYHDQCIIIQYNHMMTNISGALCGLGT